MKKSIFLLFILSVSVIANAQIITTFAGGGSCTGVACGDGGPATNAKVGLPVCGSFDAAGNYYFWHDGAGPKVRKVNTAGIITHVAGTGIQGFSGDGGPATSANIRLGWTCVDSAGNIYLSDNNIGRIRKIDAATGIINTICGNGTLTTTGDGGLATAATTVPFGICCDKQGNLFVCDNGYIRRIDATSGIITTIAGNGLGGFTGDGGPATAAGIGTVEICIDSAGNLYIGGAIRIRKINMATGIITHYAGNGTVTYSGDGIPATSAGFRERGIAMDKNNNLYIADENNERIRMVNPSGNIYTVAGIGSPCILSGDGGAATAATLCNPQGVAIDACGNLFIADDNNQRIRKVAFNPTCNPTLNTPNITALKEIKVLPNPTNGEVHIENISANTTYRLVNLVGATIMQGKIQETNNSISVSHLPPGMYMLELMDEKGLRTLRKIQKQ